MSQICRTKSPTRVTSRKGRRKRVDSIDNTIEEKQEKNSLTTPSLCYLKPVSTDSTQKRGRSESCSVKPRSSKLKERSFSEPVDEVDSHKNLSNNFTSDELSEVNTFICENLLKNESEKFSRKNNEFQNNHCSQTKEKVYHPKDTSSQLIEKQKNNLSQHTVEDFKSSFQLKQISDLPERVERGTGLGKMKQEEKDQNGKEQDKKEREKGGIVYSLKSVAQSSSKSRVSLYKAKPKTNNDKLVKVPEIIIDQHDLKTNSPICNNIEEGLTVSNNLNKSSTTLNDLNEVSSVFNDIKDSSICNDVDKCSTKRNNIKENSKVCFENGLQESSTVYNKIKESSTVYNEIKESSTVYNEIKECSTICNEIKECSTVCNDIKESSTLCNEIKESSTLCNNLKESLTLYDDLKNTKYDKNISKKPLKPYTNGKYENGITNNCAQSKQLNSDSAEHTVKEISNDCALTGEDNLNSKKMIASENCHTSISVNNNEHKFSSNEYPLSENEKSSNCEFSNKNEKEYTLTKEGNSDLDENNFSENKNGYYNVLKQKPTNGSIISKNNSALEKAKFTNFSHINDRNNGTTNELPLNIEGEKLISSENKNLIKKKWISPYLRSRESLKKK